MLYDDQDRIVFYHVFLLEIKLHDFPETIVCIHVIEVFFSRNNRWKRTKNQYFTRSIINWFKWMDNMFYFSHSFANPPSAVSRKERGSWEPVSFIVSTTISKDTR